MNNNNERLAAIIAEKLKEKGLIKSEDKTFETLLSKGNIKETDWKFAIEEVLNTSNNDENESVEENETE